MKLSHGLMMLFAPLIKVIASNMVILNSVADAIETELKRVGKRGNGTYYPCDLKRVKMVLETVHDVTGLHCEASVVDGDFESAIQSLKIQLTDEDYIIDLDGLFIHS